MDWRHHAACREVDPELFFPIGNTGPALLQIEEAKRVCRRELPAMGGRERPGRGRLGRHERRRKARIQAPARPDPGTRTRLSGTPPRRGGCACGNAGPYAR
jgi:WhiB family redox-sensing transcriptional regulator